MDYDDEEEDWRRWRKRKQNSSLAFFFKFDSWIILIYVFLDFNFLGWSVYFEFVLRFGILLLKFMKMLMKMKNKWGKKRKNKNKIGCWWYTISVGEFVQH
jgi:hypothetical protein